MRLWTVRAGPGRVSVVSRPLGDELLVSEIEELRDEGVDVLVSMLSPDELPVLGLTDEELVAPFVGLRFVSVPTPDEHPPERSADVAGLLAELAADVREGRHVAVHCHAGHGRSPAFAAALLVHAGRAAEDAMRELSEVRGRSVPHRDEQREWVRWVEAQLLHR